MTQRGVMVQVSLNVAKLVKIRSDAMPREDVNSSGIISADGTRILLAGRLFGVPIPARVAGIDLMSGALALCARDGLRPYFLGAPAVFSARSSPKYTRRAI
jgi:N-acetylglucosaminyldiphosphoundecaprenol N-acetyl-beta-D-mannosaminyltransferase